MAENKKRDPRERVKNDPFLDTIFDPRSGPSKMNNYSSRESELSTPENSYIPPEKIKNSLSPEGERKMAEKLTQEIWGDYILLDHDRPRKERGTFVDLGFYALGLVKGGGLVLEKFVCYRGDNGTPESLKLLPAPFPLDAETSKKYSLHGMGIKPGDKNEYLIVVPGEAGQKYEDILYADWESLKVHITKGEDADNEGGSRTGDSVYVIFNLFSCPGLPLPPAETKKVIKRAFRALMWYLSPAGAVPEGEAGTLVWKERETREESNGYKLTAEEASAFEKWWESLGGLDGCYDYQQKTKDTLILRV